VIRRLFGDHVRFAIIVRADSGGPVTANLLLLAHHQI
jgi:hypothetical protein